ncbi:hypothetical protein, partial [Phyllobacterium sp. P5_D12]
MTTRHLQVIILSALLSGCAGIQSQLDNEKISSLRYDNVACPVLVAQRNQAVAEISRLTNGRGYQ